MHRAFAVYRSDGCLAINPMCFGHIVSNVFYRKSADDNDLLKLKKICEQVFPRCEFAIVPVHVSSSLEPEHWNVYTPQYGDWWSRHCELNRMENLLATAD